MLSFQERCRQDGCDRSRGRYSIFCDEHHREQLIRVGLERDTPPDPCEKMPDKCRRLLRACEVGAIARDEVFTSIFDLFLHLGKQGLERCWGPCFDALPADTVAGLLAHAKAHPEPRMFHPLPEAEAARREAERLALAVQDRLLHRLEGWPPPGAKQGATDEDWYQEHRRAVEASFTDDHVVADPEEVHPSPSNRYRLLVRDYTSEGGGWNYTRELVYADRGLVADVRRNYGMFHFGWAEEHPDGHDYLMCGEDYQGQTLIQLDTGLRADYVPQQAKSGHGFCPTAYFPSPDRKLIIIEGCYWACPYQLVFCRFDDPMSLPWPEIERVELSGELQGWTGEGFVYESSEDIRVTDDKTYDELPEVEQDELSKRWSEIGGRRIRRWLRTFDGSKTLLSERVVPVAQPGG